MYRVNAGDLTNEATLYHTPIDIYAREDVPGIQISHLFHTHVAVRRILCGLYIMPCACYEMHTSCLGQIHNELQIALEAVTAVLHNGTAAMFLEEKHILSRCLECLLIEETYILSARIWIETHIAQCGHAYLLLQLLLKIRRRWLIKVLKVQCDMLVG